MGALLHERHMTDTCNISLQRMELSAQQQLPRARPICAMLNLCSERLPSASE